jgi:hypothetical protein
MKSQLKLNAQENRIRLISIWYISLRDLIIKIYWHHINGTEVTETVIAQKLKKAKSVSAIYLHNRMAVISLQDLT